VRGGHSHVAGSTLLEQTRRLVEARVSLAQQDLIARGVRGRQLERNYFRIRAFREILMGARLDE
jgi:hypothetical protein